MITEIIEAVYFCVGAVDGQTVRIPFADREVFVTFRVRRQFSSKFHFLFFLVHIIIVPVEMHGTSCWKA